MCLHQVRHSCSKETQQHDFSIWYDLTRADQVLSLSLELLAMSCVQSLNACTILNMQDAAQHVCGSAVVAKKINEAP